MFMELKVLNLGSVQLLDTMGSDLTVCNAARVSYGGESEFVSDDKASAFWERIEAGEDVVDAKYTEAYVSYFMAGGRLKPKDFKLLNFLARHKHWTPFGQPQLQFRLKMPIAIARQFMRHNVGIVYNERSARYCDFSDNENYIPDKWRMQAATNRQASCDNHVEDTHGRLNKAVEEHFDNGQRIYTRLIAEGVAKEQARFVLPVAGFTEIYATMSLAALCRIISLRDKEDAQYEIQQYAKAMRELAVHWFPASIGALT